MKIGGLLLAPMAVCAMAFGPQADARAKQAPEINTLATADQTEVTARALRAVSSETVGAARKLAEYRWKAVLRDAPPQEAWASFDSMLDDYVFNYALKAANSDANYPRVVHVYTPPHTWQGMQVPGSRWGGDNPDNVYRIIPIDGKARFRLDGKLSANPPPNVSYTLIGNWETSKTLGGIENSDILVNRDGTFSITLDPEPANGRNNHIQTRPGALLLFIRDSMSDWKQQANALTIHRLDPPDAPPLSDQQVAEKTADILVDGVPLVYWFYQLAHSKPNDIPQLQKSGANGGLLTQRGGTGLASLADDEALVITMNPSDAAYYSVVAHNNWFITIDYANHTSSLNNGQAARNPDGTVSFVVAPRDPGVHNWIDTAGLNNSVLVLRVQGLSKQPAYEPSIRTQVVKTAELKSVLPAQTRWVTPAERAAQIAERRRLYAKRMADR
jgi:hypothetical protein